MYKIISFHGNKTKSEGLKSFAIFLNRFKDFPKGRNIQEIVKRVFYDKMNSKDVPKIIKKDNY